MAPSAETALRRAVFCGLPVVKCGRGNTEGVASNQEPWFIRGNDLTATKARILLMACLLRYGSLPPAVDPTKPDIHERQATIKAVKQFQTIFDTH
jgi:L-asparaginase/Glu-tRNA(Gln) amidotransferase subunit D